MVWNLRTWDRLRELRDDFNRRDFQLVTAFADALTVHELAKYPGTVVTGNAVSADDVMQLINDQSHGSIVRTLGRQYKVDNPQEILIRAVNMIGVNVPETPMPLMPHYSDSLIKSKGGTLMISEIAMRKIVHHSVFNEGDASPDIAPEGMYSFAVKVQFATPEAETPRTETYSLRASSPEEAKGMAAKIAAEMGYINFSVLGVEVVPYTGPLAPGLVPHTAPVNVQPGATAGLVKPSDVSPALPNTGVLTPMSG